LACVLLVIGSFAIASNECCFKKREVWSTPQRSAFAGNRAHSVFGGGGTVVSQDFLSATRTTGGEGVCFPALFMPCARKLSQA